MLWAVFGLFQPNSFLAQGITFFPLPWLRPWGAWSFLGKRVPRLYDIISFYSLFFVSRRAYQKSWASLEDFYLLPGGTSVGAAALGKCLWLRGCQILVLTRSAQVWSLQMLLRERHKDPWREQLSWFADGDGEWSVASSSFHLHVLTSFYHRAERSPPKVGSHELSC